MPIQIFYFKNIKPCNNLVNKLNYNNINKYQIYKSMRIILTIKLQIHRILNYNYKDKIINLEYNNKINKENILKYQIYKKIVIINLLN